MEWLESSLTWEEASEPTHLANTGAHVPGIDPSDEMFDIARTKSTDIPDVHWIQADMRPFELEERFGLAIVPAYSFQLLLTESDQASCLNQIARYVGMRALGLSYIWNTTISTGWHHCLRATSHLSSLQAKRSIRAAASSFAFPLLGLLTQPHGVWPASSDMRRSQNPAKPPIAQI